MQRRRFYVAPDEVGAACINLSRDESHHLARVLRLREGDEAFAFDGRGREYRCRVSRVDAQAARLEIIEALAGAVESLLDLTLAQALAKGEKFDFIVQKAAELGVRRIIPLVTDHSDVRLNDERAEKRAERWRRIALEALKQSGGRRLVQIQAPAAFSDFITSTPREGAPPVRLVFSERGGSPISQALKETNAGQPVIACVGPEGGWSDGELETMASHGARLVTLGPRILRTETAAIVAVALIQHRLGDLSRD